MKQGIEHMLKLWIKYQHVLNALFHFCCLLTLMRQD